MSSPPKNYKIIVDSKYFRNMKGICPAEVAKKAAGKILSLSNNRITQFSIIETKNGKIRNYKAFKENLIRPYKKNGKLIKCRIIVKKLVKHTGGGDIRELLVKSKREFTEAEIIRIKKEMFVYNCITNSNVTKPEYYEPYNLTEKNIKLIQEGNRNRLRSTEFLELGENDPIRYFFPKDDFNIGFILRDDEGTVGHMKLSYNDPDKKKCNIFYEFTGNEDSFKLHIYNLESCFGNLTSEDAALFLLFWEEYIIFLGKLYPEAIIQFDFYYDVPNLNNRNIKKRILKVPIVSPPNSTSSLTNKQKNYITSVGLDFYAHFNPKSNSNSNMNSVWLSNNDKLSIQN
jgi:hypothetical protein